MGISKGMDVKSVWNYSDRTLTQSQFPFWSAVSVLNSTYQSVSAGSVGQVTIRPPSGETWYIIIDTFIDVTVDGSWIEYLRATSLFKDFTISGAYNPKKPTCRGSYIIDYSNYLVCKAKNNDSSNAHNMFYGYSVFKLGTKKMNLETVEKNIVNGMKSVERKTKYKIPSVLDDLSNDIFDVYDHDTDDYEQVIYIYKDKPVRRDKNTGHIVESVSQYVEIDKLLEILEKIKTGELEVERTGYKNWLEQIKKERGIDLLGRL